MKIILDSSGSDIKNDSILSESEILTIFNNDSIVYTGTNENNCSASDTISAEFYQIPVINHSTLPDLCSNSPDLHLDSFAAPRKGIWMAEDSSLVQNNYFLTSKAGIGSFKLKYTFTDSNNCTATSETYINVFQAPNVFAGLGDSLCSYDGKYSLHGLPKGGLWSGPGVVDSFFMPDMVSIIGKKQLFLLKYSFIDTNLCSNSDSIKLLVYKPVDVDAGKNDTICINANMVKLNGDPSGGVWYGKGVINGYLNPVLAGSGNHLIYYLYQNGLCYSYDSAWVFLPAKPDTTLLLRNDTLFASLGNNTYKWYLNNSELNGKTDAFIKVILTGVYHAKITDQYGCEFTTNSISYSSVYETRSDGIKIIPNPTYNELTLYYNDQNTCGFNVEIYNLFGEKLNLYKDVCLPYKLYLNDLPAGCYLIFLKSEGMLRKALIEKL